MIQEKPVNAYNPDGTVKEVFNIDDYTDDYTPVTKADLKKYANLFNSNYFQAINTFDGINILGTINNIPASIFSFISGLTSNVQEQLNYIIQNFSTLEYVNSELNTKRDYDDNEFSYLTINSQEVSTKNYVDTSINNLVGGANDSLNTLYEISNALNGNQSIETSLVNQIALKAPIDNPTFTGVVGGITKSMVGLENVDNIPDIDKIISNPTKQYVDENFIKTMNIGSVSSLSSISNASATLTKTTNTNYQLDLGIPRGLGLTFRGEWDSGLTYYINDIAYHDGSSYCCIVGNLGYNPSNHSEYWQLIVLKGDKGERGPSGSDGSNGSNGSDGSDGKDGSNGSDGRDGRDGDASAAIAASVIASTASVAAVAAAGSAAASASSASASAAASAESASIAKTTADQANAKSDEAVEKADNAVQMAQEAKDKTINITNVIPEESTTIQGQLVCSKLKSDEMEVRSNNLVLRNLTSNINDEFDIKPSNIFTAIGNAHISQTLDCFTLNSKAIKIENEFSSNERLLFVKGGDSEFRGNINLNGNMIFEEYLEGPNIITTNIKGSVLDTNELNIEAQFINIKCSNPTIGQITFYHSPFLHYEIPLFVNSYQFATCKYVESRISERIQGFGINQLAGLTGYPT